MSFTLPPLSGQSQQKTARLFFCLFTDLRNSSWLHFASISLQRCPSFFTATLHFELMLNFTSFFLLCFYPRSNLRLVFLKFLSNRSQSNTGTVSNYVGSTRFVCSYANLSSFSNLKLFSRVTRAHT